LDDSYHSAAGRRTLSGLDSSFKTEKFASLIPGDRVKKSPYRHYLADKERAFAVVEKLKAWRTAKQESSPQRPWRHF
jgi:hypothetical protein